MNREDVVKKMILFIEEKEREAQVKKAGTSNRDKVDVVKAILDELEREMADEN